MTTFFHRSSLLLLIALPFFVHSQFTPQDLGFRHTIIVYEKDSVDVLIYSKRGDELKQKPLFFFCQGSMPQPLIRYDSIGPFAVFPFNPDRLAERYHLILAGKPGTPLTAAQNELGPNFTYL